MAKVFIKLNCPKCNENFEIERYAYNSKLRRQGYKIYCSRSCYLKNKTINPKSFTCIICNKDFPNIKSCKERKYCSRPCRYKDQKGKAPSAAGYKWTEEQRKIRPGSFSNLWKGGITATNKVIRMSLEYKLWRVAVFERDSYTCIWCGKKGVDLHADHIKPFAYYPDLRLEISNGRTLCAPCHKTTDTYGHKAKNYQNNN